MRSVSMSSMPLPGRAAVGLVVLALLVGVGLVVTGSDDQVRVTAHFERATGLYRGSEVRVLGVPVGRVTSIEPHGDRVVVELVYDSEYAVPAEAQALIVSPSVVSDRFVQLTPGYSGGAALENGDTIPLQRTQVPLELDEVYSTLNDLFVALGPKGANRSGSLSRLLKVGAANLDGQGAKLNRTLKDVAAVSDVLGDGRHDLFGTVRHLRGFVGELGRNDAQVRRFNRTAAEVFGQLADEGTQLRLTLRHLSRALARVERFIRVNRDALSRNVAGLTKVSRVLVAERKGLEEMLDVAPLGLNNLNNAYAPEIGGGLRSRANQVEGFRNPDGLFCQAVKANGVPRGNLVCRLLATLLEPAPQPEGGHP